MPTFQSLPGSGVPRTATGPGFHVSKAGAHQPKPKVCSDSSRYDDLPPIGTGIGASLPVSNVSRITLATLPAEICRGGVATVLPSALAKLSAAASSGPFGDATRSW